MGTKSDNAEISRRVEEVLRIRLDGGQFHDIVQYGSEKGWNVTDRQIRKYIARADELLVERQDKKRKQVIARHQRHRHRQDLLERQRRGDEGHIQREGDHGDAKEQHGVRQHGESGAILDHQYWTLRSTKRNCSAVSTMTMHIRITDCAEEPPISAALTPS